MLVVSTSTVLIETELNSVTLHTGAINNNDQVCRYGSAPSSWRMAHEVSQLGTGICAYC